MRRAARNPQHRFRDVLSAQRDYSVINFLGACRVALEPHEREFGFRKPGVDRCDPQAAYRVRLRANGAGLEWLSNDGEKEMILTEEPDSTPWLRIKSWLLTPFVPIEQL